MHCLVPVKHHFALTDHPWSVERTQPLRHLCVFAIAMLCLCDSAVKYRSGCNELEFTFPVPETSYSMRFARSNAPALGIGLLCCVFAFSCVAANRMLTLAEGRQQPPASVAPTAHEADPKGLFAKGQAALQANDLDAAEAAFRKVLTVDPRAGAAYANLGVIAMRRKQWDHALALLQKAEKLDPKMAGIRLNIGLVKYRRGDYAGAKPPLTSVLRDQPDSQQARYLLGLCNVFTEHYAEAVSVLEPLWSQQSNNFMYLYVFGIAAHGAGRKELDEKALSRLLEVGGNAPEFHLILGKAYLNRDEPEKAVVELERAATGNPNLPYVHFSLGVAYVHLHQEERAEAEFGKDLAVEPDLPDTYEALGDFYLRAGKNDEARKFFEEALKRNPKMASALFGVAKIHFQEQKYPQALTAIDSAQHLAPDSQPVHYLRGQILARLGRRDEAQKELAVAQKILNSQLGKRRESLSDDRVPNPELAEPPQ